MHDSSNNPQMFLVINNMFLKSDHVGIDYCRWAQSACTLSLDICGSHSRGDHLQIVICTATWTRPATEAGNG